MLFSFRVTGHQNKLVGSLEKEWALSSMDTEFDGT